MSMSAAQVKPILASGALLGDKLQDAAALTPNPALTIPGELQSILNQMMTANPPVVYLHGTEDFEFLPVCYALLNQHMTNRQVVSPVP
jgi:hypothetical protein